MLKDYYVRIASLMRLRKNYTRVKKAAMNGETNLSFGPSSLNLMMADTCNSQCIMCGHDYKAKGSCDMLTLEKVKTIYDHLNIHEVVDVIYGGGGEPFMNPELAEISEYTRALDPIIQHTVITNALHGDETTYMRLLKSRSHFLCSINAAFPETFRVISGMNRFEQVMDNLRLIVRLRKRVRATVNISISMILMRQNIDELSDFIKLASKVGIDGVKALYVRIYPDAYRRRSNVAAQIQREDSLFYCQEHSDQILKEAKVLSQRLGIEFKHSPLFSDSKSFNRDCIEPWRSLFINFNGDVYPCPASEIQFMNKINSCQYISGNILEQPVMEFWNNSFWQALRRTNSGREREEIVPECLCCGNAVYWKGAGALEAHVLDWKKSEQSTLKL